MFRKRLVRDLLYNNQNKRNPACASASNEDVEEEHDGANEHEEEHDNDANSVPDSDASVQASQENGEARQEDEDTIRKEEHDNDDETMCENEEAETGGGPPEEDINTSESKEAPKSITPSNKRIISPNTQLRKMMTSSTVVSLHNQRNTTSLPTAKSLHNQRDTTSSSTSKQNEYAQLDLLSYMKKRWLCLLVQRTVKVINITAVILDVKCTM
uniref:Uncharacterized protein n=1 Tax=Oryza punctata TaxID=4537 RepID=A0A0E0LA53_ORYPU